MEQDLFDIGIEIPNPADMGKSGDQEDTTNELEIDNEVEDLSEDVVDDIEEEVEADYEPEKRDSSIDDDDDEVTPEKVFYNFLVEKKFIDEDEDFDGSPEKLETYMENIGYYAFNKVAEGIGEDGKNLLKYALALGEDVSKEKLQEFFSVRAQVPEIDFDDEDEVKAFLKDYYLATNQYGEDDVDDRIEFLETKGKLSSFAEKHYNELLENINAYEEQQISIEQQKQQAKQELFNSVKTELMSYEWSLEKKKQVADKLNNKEFRRINNMIQQSPKALIQLADLYTYFDEEKQEFDLSSLIQKRQATKKAEKSLDNLEKNSFSSSLSSIKNISRTKKGRGGVYIPIPILDEE